MKATNTEIRDHYSTLGISSSVRGNLISAQDLKAAYHRALLRHHPDKSRHPRSSTTSPDNTIAAAISVHDVTSAYQTLSNPITRAEYDILLRLQLGKKLSKSGNGQVAETFRSGLEIVDLDDLEYDELSNVWYRSCRCGEQRGFVVTERDLEAEAKNGELTTGCRGCSLWLNVLFQASDEGQTSGG
ncbi:MAG: hypothetical protein M1836_006948 [Candelina mexicana]|nr:MAG: hypothetical protein M1836_006948 [Candelina mexicana]